MSTDTIVTLADGREARIVGDDAHDTITVQLLSSAGAPLGQPITVAQPHDIGGGFAHVRIDTSSVAVTALTDGGFEVVYHASTSDAEGFSAGDLEGVRVSADGHVGSAVHLAAVESSARGAGGFGGNPQLTELAGGRFAVSYDSQDFDTFERAHHLALADANGVVYKDLVVDPGATVTASSGDITVTSTVNGVTFREILGLDGSVLTPRFEVHEFTQTIGDFSGQLVQFTAHDQLTLVNPGGAVAGGPNSELVFSETSTGTGMLVWVPDTNHPENSFTIGQLPVGSFGIQNLADGFRPAVLKVISPQGQTSYTWFDANGSQTWDTQYATYDIHGQLTTYGATLDDGTSHQFTFDVDNVQPWTRYVDTFDAGGHLQERSVLYDDNTSWTAKFAYAGGQIVSYELDNFDTQGHQVATSFFHADGTPF